MENKEYLDKLHKAFYEMKADDGYHYEPCTGFIIENNKIIKGFWSRMTKRVVYVYLENGILKPYFKPKMQ